MLPWSLSETQAFVRRQQPQITIIPKTLITVINHKWLITIRAGLRSKAGKKLHPSIALIWMFNIKLSGYMFTQNTRFKEWKVELEYCSGMQKRAFYPTTDLWLVNSVVKHYQQVSSPLGGKMWLAVECLWAWKDTYIQMNDHFWKSKLKAIQFM